MKTRKLLLLFASISLLIACNSSGGNNNPPAPPGPDEHEINSFEEAKNDVLTYHNYTAEVVNMWAIETTPWVQFNVYNLNNDAIYDDLEGYYSGYIKQKNQGIVNFRAPKTGTGIVVGSFRSTNLDRNVIDVEQTAPDHIFEKEFVYDDSINAYTCSDRNALAVIANLSFGEWAELSIAPEYFTATFNNKKVIFTSIFRVMFSDEGVDYDFNATVTITVSKFGATYNESLLDYIDNPSVIYEAPTEWDNSVKEYFDDYYNGFYPPFIEGLSYSWKYGQSVSEGSFTTRVEDYYNGDLTDDYETILINNGFTKVTNPAYLEYAKSVTEGQTKHTYSVKMKYYAPTERDANNMEYSYLYPNGVSSFNFLYKRSTVSAINTVGLLNEYIAQTSAGWFIPAINLDDSTRVSGFNDATSGSSFALLLKGTSGYYFDIYPDTKQHAITFFNAYETYLESKGFTDQDSRFLGMAWFSDDYGSEIRITDPSLIDSWTSNTKLQISIGIKQETLDAHIDDTVTIQSLILSGQKTVFTVGEEFVFDGTATVVYSNGQTAVVTPTQIIEPNMNLAETQTVYVSYTDEENRTVTTSYQVTINEVGTKYNINVINPSGATITVLQPENELEALPGDIVKFAINVSLDYNLGTISVTSNGNNVSYMGPHILTGEYQFTMPAGDVVIAATTSPVIVTHSITYVIKDSATGNVLSYNDVISSNSTLPTTFTENSVILFTVLTNSGYSFASATIGNSTFNNSSFTYNGLNSNIEVTIYVTQQEQEDVLYGSYVFYRPWTPTNPEYYDRYTIILNEDGTGSYVREMHNANPTTYELTFTYVVNRNNITFTYQSGDNTDFYNGYRLFDSENIDPRSVNNTGVINGDGTISVTLIKSGALDQTYTFSK